MGAVVAGLDTVEHRVTNTEVHLELVEQVLDLSGRHCRSLDRCGLLRTALRSFLLIGKRLESNLARRTRQRRDKQRADTLDDVEHRLRQSRHSARVRKTLPLVAYKELDVRVYKIVVTRREAVVVLLTELIQFPSIGTFLISVHLITPHFCL